MGSVQRRRPGFFFKTRPELDAQLTRLEQEIPLLLKRYPNPDDFWPHYAAVTDEILTATGAEDDQHVCMRLDAILGAHGLMPRDDIDQPCNTTRPHDGDKRLQN